jgi:hypothetical protein
MNENANVDWGRKAMIEKVREECNLNIAEAEKSLISFLEGSINLTETEIEVERTRLALSQSILDIIGG